MLHQMAMTRYVKTAVDTNTLRPYLTATNLLYQKAAARMMEAIEMYLGFPALAPSGGLFTCVKVSTDGDQFVKDILQRCGVLFVPGWGFGATLVDAVRVSYGPLVNDPDRIAEGFEKVGRSLGR